MTVFRTVHSRERTRVGGEWTKTKNERKRSKWKNLPPVLEIVRFDSEDVIAASVRGIHLSGFQDGTPASIILGVNGTIFSSNFNANDAAAALGLPSVNPNAILFRWSQTASLPLDNFPIINSGSRFDENARYASYFNGANGAYIRNSAIDDGGTYYFTKNQ